MAKPSDREFALKRQIKDLQTKVDNLEMENKHLKKKLEQNSGPVVKSKKTGKAVEKPCPDCGAEIKETTLPFGKLKLCSKACGYRETIKG